MQSVSYTTPIYYLLLCFTKKTNFSVLHTHSVNTERSVTLGRTRETNFVSCLRCWFPLPSGFNIEESRTTHTCAYSQTHLYSLYHTHTSNYCLPHQNYGICTWCVVSPTTLPRTRVKRWDHKPSLGTKLWPSTPKQDRKHLSKYYLSAIDVPLTDAAEHALWLWP